MSSVLFRCSSLGKLMSEPKSKTVYFVGGVELKTQKANKMIDEAIVSKNFEPLKSLELKEIKDLSGLSETAKTYVREVWLQNKYDYQEKVITDEMLKGSMVEQDSMQLFQDVTKSKFLFKNTETKRNDYFIGTADIINGDYVDDLKSSWSLRTFMDCEPTTDNIFQIKAYMDLWQKKKGRIAYCLVPTPEELITEMKKRYYFKFNCDESNPHYIEISKQIDRNNDVILTIPIEQRVKIFEFDYNQDEINQIYSQIEKARIYYNTLKL